MALDEAGTLAHLNKLQIELVDPKIVQFKGRVVGSQAQSMLCNVQWRPKSNSPPKLSICPKHGVMFRMAINLGDVIAESGTI